MIIGYLDPFFLEKNLDPTSGPWPDLTSSLPCYLSLL